MELGRCRRCGRPYSAAEVAALGILHARPASAGGPHVVFPCPGCKTEHPFVPHGSGRYAPPGEPPPPAPTPEELRPPWAGVERALPGRAVAAAGDAVAVAASAPPTPLPSPSPAASPFTASAPTPHARTPNAREAEEPALQVEEARTLLRVARGARPEEVEEAFRERALLCHPDKVAHLDPELQAFAERKFRRLEAARRLLTGAQDGRSQR